MIKYNFYNLFKSIEELSFINEKRNEVQIQKICESIKAELNNFFGKEFTCTECIYTMNTDKPLFGIFVRPVISTYCARYLISNENNLDNFNIIPRYQLEIDSKIFNLGLTSAEIGTIILHDINAINNKNSYNIINSSINAILAFSNISINKERVDKTIPLLCTIIEITIKNFTSIFNKNYNISDENNIIVPDFISGYNLSSSFISAINKLKQLSNAIKVEYPTLLLTWYLKIVISVSDIFEANDKYIYSILQKAIELESSELVKRSILVTINKLYNSSYNFSQLKSVNESKKGGLISQMKRNGIRSLEDDLYEYSMRLRNVETQDDAILLMRQINSRMSILEDYLREEDLDETDRKRWEKCYEKYLNIRDELSKKTVYNKKMYGLFVDYNALQNMSQNGMLMNTYY